VDHRADIYSLGTVLYEMVVGDLPYKGDTPVKLMMERLQRAPTPPRQRNPAVPLGLEAVLLRALAQKPDDRFERMTGMLAELEGLRRAARQRATVSGERSTQVIQRDQLPLGPRLSIAGTGVLIPLTPEKEMIIGRSATYSEQAPDVDLADHGGGQAGVSRMHARLTCAEGRWYLEDLNSTNGTGVNGQALLPGEPVGLNDGDMIQFGSMSVTFYGG
jgi:serine/threonine protein kinase